MPAEKGDRTARQSQLSLMEVLDHTCTASGQKRLQTWLRRPLQKIEAIKERQDTIGLFLQQMHRPAMDTMRAALSKIGNVPYHLTMLANRMKLPNWQQLSSFLKAAIAIEDALSSLSIPHDFASTLFRQVSPLALFF